MLQPDHTKSRNYYGIIATEESYPYTCIIEWCKTFIEIKYENKDGFKQTMIVIELGVK